MKSLQYQLRGLCLRELTILIVGVPRVAEDLTPGRLRANPSPPWQLQPTDLRYGVLPVWIEGYSRPPEDQSGQPHRQQGLKPADFDVEVRKCDLPKAESVFW
jgi:hypothetical protein